MEHAERRVVLVTGSTDGIGRETARELVRAGFHVVVHGRSKATVDATLGEFARELPATNLEGVSFDLGSLAAVRKGAAHLLERLPALHVVIHNAGIFADERTLSSDRIELTFAVNYVAPWLLSELLAPRLIASAVAAPSRIISVSSVAHTRGRIHFEDVSLGRNWTGYAAYAQSKLAQVMHALSLAERHDPTKLVAYSLHPGVIGTKLLRRGFGPIAGGSVSSGARCSVRLACETTVSEPSGSYFSDDTVSPPVAAAQGRGDRERLWQLTADLTKVPATSHPDRTP